MLNADREEGTVNVLGRAGGGGMFVKAWYCQFEAVERG